MENENVSPEEETEEVVRTSDDTPAFQAVVCIIIATALFILNIVSPDIGGDIMKKVRDLSGAEQELFTNPIDIVENYISKL